MIYLNQKKVYMYEQLSSLQTLNLAKEAFSINRRQSLRSLCALCLQHHESEKISLISLWLVFFCNAMEKMSLKLSYAVYLH